MSIDVKIKKTLLILTIINFSFVFLEVDSANAQVNKLPIANPDTASTTVEKPVNINVLANDIDPDGDPLTVDAISEQPTFGIAEILPSKSIRYTPIPLFDGEDNFSYTISDGRGGNATTDVHITVDPISGAPQARNDDVSTPENTPIIIDVLANDIDREGDHLMITDITSPSNGENEINDGGQTITYTPNTNFVGVDTFIYTIFDGVTGTDTATVTVTVTKGNIPPVLDPIGNKEAVENTALAFTATATDADIPPQTLSFSLAGDVPQGASITSAGAFTWTPTEAQGPGSYTFDVVVSDGTATDMENIVVTVSEVTQIQNTPGKITAGGAQMNEDVNFGFNIQFSKNILKGQLEYKDKAMKINLHSITMTALHVSSDKTTGIFTGTATINGIPGFTFFVEVKDGGEPGKNDMLKLIILEKSYMKSGNLMKGNIQIH